MAQRHALAGARRSHEHVVHALLNTKVEAVEDLAGAEPLAYVAQFDHPFRK